MVAVERMPAAPEADAGAAVVIAEKQLNAQTLADTILGLLGDADAPEQVGELEEDVAGAEHPDEIGTDSKDLGGQL